MGFLQIQLMNLLAILMIIASSKSSLSATPPKFPIALKPNCTDQCGNISIPYPFGTTEECYQSPDFLVTCNQAFNPPKVSLRNSNIEITEIKLDGQLRVLKLIAYHCYNQDGTSASDYKKTRIQLARSRSITVSNTANKFTVIGCDTYGYIFGRRLDKNYTKGQQLDRNYRTGCIAMCSTKDDLTEGSCTGSGCCQIPIPEQVWQVNISLGSFQNHNNVWSFDRCSYAFLVEESAFSFSPENLTNLRNVKKLPMVLDWAIGNGTCEEAQMNASSYACKNVNSKCYKPNNGYGYRCSCLEGYQGNPYLIDGCKDVNECEDPHLNNCIDIKQCKNTIGSFHCACPRGYHGDGRKDGRGCIHGESLAFKLAAGISLGIIVLLLVACWLHLELKRRKQTKMRQMFFLQNGGVLLQEKISRRERSSDTTTIFSELEVQKATNNFDNNMIIGKGGFGIVYKGFLPNNRIVAIKKSKEVDPGQIGQFINEVIILSQINHRNVVKLLGCCLETQVPLLVYEFINNGTLFEHIHNEAKARFFSWEMRLKVAAETANVLAYLHSVASIPIIHRDVKSANILLDHTLTAKVSDFGASRLFPLDQTQLSTLVHGTLGYLDPEYMQTNLLTEKSDVYSFGVVLVELLTGKKVLSFDRPEDERGLASLFLSVMKKDRLFEILEENVMREGNKKQLVKVAMVAKSCLHVKGDERPSMKEVAMELEGLMLGEKHPWVQTGHDEEVKGFLLEGEFSGAINVGEDNSTSIGFDSAKDHVMLSMGGGR
ncbi:Serine/threonine protein kinase [Handroanthus impetiginosus]|uniref:Serine/threonine protein kinase n=1 Tax=Handroanthus impetiginosus TaxID=429701 RepID=A0A2G9GE42_9LAMI|nr:Serine/threonine protein kinase [Handroanthus impetiginosus]